MRKLVYFLSIAFFTAISLSARAAVDLAQLDSIVTEEVSRALRNGQLHYSLEGLAPQIAQALKAVDPQSDPLERLRRADAWAQRLFNYYGDMLRQPQAVGAYARLVKAQVQVVREVKAQGKVGENPSFAPVVDHYRLRPEVQDAPYFIVSGLDTQAAIFPKLFPPSRRIQVRLPREWAAELKQESVALLEEGLDRVVRAAGARLWGRLPVILLREEFAAKAPDDLLLSALVHELKHYLDDRDELPAMNWAERVKDDERHQHSFAQDFYPQWVAPRMQELLDTPELRATLNFREGPDAVQAFSTQTSQLLLQNYLYYESETETGPYAEQMRFLLQRHSPDQVLKMLAPLPEADRPLGLEKAQADLLRLYRFDRFKRLLETLSPPNR